jgi:hydrogenase-4 membrane subunit HyfE
MIQQWQKRVLQAVVMLVVVATGARLVWALLEPAVPELVSLAVVLVVLGVAVYGRRSK